MPVATPPVIHKSASHSTDLCQDGRVVPQPKRKNSKPGARDGVLAGRTGRTFAGDLLGSCGSSRSEPDHFRKKNIYIYIISESFSKALGPGTQHHPTPPGSSGKKNLFGWDFGGPVSFLKSQVFDRPGFSQSLLLIGQEPGLLSPTRPGLCFRTCQNLSWNPLATYTEH